MKKRKWRIIPKITYTNWHKYNPATKGLWNRWFAIDRWWSGRIIHISIRYYSLELDFRRNWVEDMLEHKGL